MARVHLSHGGFAGRLAAPVGVDRIDRIALPVGACPGAIEHVVCGDVQERELGIGAGDPQDEGAVCIGRKGRGSLGFGAIDIGVGRGIDHERGSVRVERLHNGCSIADVGLRAGECRECNLSLASHPRELLAKLAVAAEDKDHATTPRRSPR